MVVVVVVASVSDVQTPLLAVPVGERDGDGVCVSVVLAFPRCVSLGLYCDVAHLALHFD